MKRVVLITGVNGRLGMDFCKRYGKDYTIVGVARRPCLPPVPNCHYIQADITKDYEKIVDKTLDFYGRIDVLINNAAIYSIKDLSNLTSEEMSSVFNTNVIAPYALVRECYLKFWKDRPEKNKKFNRKVINVSSISSTNVYGGQLAYAPSKAALDHLNNYLKVELKNCNVSSFVINPTGFPRIVPTELVTDVLVKVERGQATEKDLLEIKDEKSSTT